MVYKLKTELKEEKKKIIKKSLRLMRIRLLRWNLEELKKQLFFEKQISSNYNKEKNNGRM